MHGPGFVDQLGFTLWLVVLHSAVLLPIFGPFARRSRRTGTPRHSR